MAKALIKNLTYDNLQEAYRDIKETYDNVNASKELVSNLKGFI